MPFFWTFDTLLLRERNKTFPNRKPQLQTLDQSGYEPFLELVLGALLMCENWMCLLPLSQ